VSNTVIPTVAIYTAGTLLQQRIDLRLVHCRRRRVRIIRIIFIMTRQTVCGRGCEWNWNCVRREYYNIFCVVQGPSLKRSNTINSRYRYFCHYIYTISNILILYCIAQVRLSILYFSRCIVGPNQLYTIICDR